MQGTVPTGYVLPIAHMGDTEMVAVEVQDIVSLFQNMAVRPDPLESIHIFQRGNYMDFGDTDSQDTSA